MNALPWCNSTTRSEAGGSNKKALGKGAWQDDRAPDEPERTPSRSDGENLRGPLRADHGLNVHLFLQRGGCGPRASAYDAARRTRMQLSLGHYRCGVLFDGLL